MVNLRMENFVLFGVFVLLAGLYGFYPHLLSRSIDKKGESYLGTVDSVEVNRQPWSTRTTVYFRFSVNGREMTLPSIQRPTGGISISPGECIRINYHPGHPNVVSAPAWDNLRNR